MSTKVERAREAIQKFSTKDKESIELSSILSLISDRTESDGMVRVTVGGKEIRIANGYLIDAFLQKKEEVDAELNDLAETFNGKRD